MDRLRQTLAEATRRQLISDVKVGSFLSGGLDSSLITALAVPHAADGFQGYTITYPASETVLDRADDDAPHARRVAKLLGLDLTEIEIKPQVAELWPQLIHHLDEPLTDPAAIACYLISKLAREHGAPVLLSGQGGDELFAGYPRYRVMDVTGRFEWVPRWLRRGVAAGAQWLPGSRAGAMGATMRRVRRALTAWPLDPDRRFLAYCMGTPEARIRAALSPAFLEAIDGQEATDACQAHMDRMGLQGVDRFLERDLAVYLPNHNLLYTDKMGMAVGLEARVPLLDMALVDLVTGYPADWKLAGGTTKVILREAAAGLVPDSIIRRPKAGFGAPYRKWLRHDLGEMWDDLTTERAVRERGWFDPGALREARRRSQSGLEDTYMLQWAVLTLELWARAFLDRNPSSETAAQATVAASHPQRS